MDATPSGDPTRELTRDDLDRLHAVMIAHEPDWVSRCALLASTLQTAIIRLHPGSDTGRLQTVVNEYYRDLEDWQKCADAYFRAVGGPIADVLPLEDEA
jgi:hypothetical protein